MIQIIGMIEVLIFYVAYFLKLLGQKRRGITTNQLGRGNKPTKTMIIEKLLRISSIIIVLVILASVILNTTFVSNQMVRGAGLILFGSGTFLFIIAMLTMKDSWRAGIPDEGKTTMITTGIYQISRNPAFLGFDLTYLGASLAFGNIILISLAIVTILLMHLQILEEEKFLEITFGSKYLEYKNKVGRYLIFF